MALYIIAIGWLYVALMMSVAEATHTTGTVLGAIITFVLYGLLPVALLMYILGTPARRRAHRARQAPAPTNGETVAAASRKSDDPGASPGTTKAGPGSHPPDAR